MKLADSRNQHTGGFWPLQHPNFQQTGKLLDTRSLLAATAVVLDQDNFGGWVHDNTATGDVLGGMVWRPNRQDRRTREMSGWRFSWPVTPEVVPVKDFDQIVGCPVVRDRRDFFPIQNNDWERDKRFEPTHLRSPIACTNKADPDGPLLPLKFPDDVIGIGLTADEERQQQPLFMPTDPRLFAMGVFTDPLMSTVVQDARPNSFRLDPDRCAHLHSAFRVVKDPPGGAICRWVNNEIAFNLGLSYCHTNMGGLFWDSSETKSGRHGVLGTLGQHMFGPMTAGHPDGGDKHFIGFDGDGNAVNEGHIHTDARFYKNVELDGPIKFDEFYQPSPVGPDNVQAFIEFDTDLRHRSCLGEKEGKWRIRSTNYDCQSPPPPVDPPPPSEVPSFDHGPIPPGGGAGMPPRQFAFPNQAVKPGGAGAFGLQKRVLPRFGEADPARSILTTHVERAVPVIVFRPHLNQSGLPDLRAVPNPNEYHDPKVEEREDAPGARTDLGLNEMLRGDPGYPVIDVGDLEERTPFNQGDNGRGRFRAFDPDFLDRDADGIPDFIDAFPDDPNNGRDGPFVVVPAGAGGDDPPQLGFFPGGGRDGRDPRGGGSPPDSSPPVRKNSYLVSYVMEAPATARLEAFSQQVDGGYKFFKEPGDESARYRFPTSQGGFFLTPPEIAIEDMVDGTFDATDICKPHFVIPPYARMSFGVPDFSTGEPKDNSFSVHMADTTDLSTVELRFDVWSSGAASQVATLHDDDFELHTADKGVILKSPNGTRYRIKVDNAGTVVTEAA